MRRFVEPIPDALDAQRVDRVVSLIADISRSRAAELVATAAVRVDGEVVGRASQRVSEGQTVSFEVAEAPDPLVADPTVEVPIVYVDEHVIVVDKPAGLVVHPAAGSMRTTMVNGLLAVHPEIRGVGEAERPGIVHRLDVGTSGVLMVARTALAYTSLTSQLAERSVERHYRTVVAGLLEADSGVIDAPLGRSERDRTRRAVVVNGKAAKTHYDVVERLEHGEQATTELTCRLETGRTHQIRAHLSAIGHPVIGDPAYGGPTSVGSVTLARPFLHAESLGFSHPADGRRLRFESPLPAELSTVLEQLKSAQ